MGGGLDVLLRFIFLPSDVACNKQLPSPLVNKGYNFGQGSFLLTHQLRRSKTDTLIILSKKVKF
jgi:hypothetical protein